MSAARASTSSPARGRATIKDVARHMGFSIMTVSRVLNHEAIVADTTRATGERAIHDLNYVPNTAAQALALARQAHRIVFLFDTPNATILGDMVSAVLEEPARPEIRLSFMRVRGDADPGATVETLKKQGVQGVVLSPPLFEQALRAFEVEPDDALCWQGDYTFGTAIGIAEQALSVNPPLTAIFASNDDMAAAVISVARGRGIAVPGIVGLRLRRPAAPWCRDQSGRSMKGQYR